MYSAWHEIISCLLRKSQRNSNITFPCSKMTAENNDFLSIFVKHASKKSSKVLFCFVFDNNTYVLYITYHTHLFHDRSSHLIRWYLYQTGLWLVGACDDIVAGKLSKEIKRLATFFLSIFPTPVYLRIGYEFDSPENAYHPISYITAFRIIVDAMRMYNVQNVVYVWHSYSQIPQGGMLQSNWYPGNRFYVQKIPSFHMMSYYLFCIVLYWHTMYTFTTMSLMHLETYRMCIFYT